MTGECRDSGTPCRQASEERPSGAGRMNNFAGINGNARHHVIGSAVILHRYGNPNDKKVIWSIVYRLRLTFDGESKKRRVSWNK
jgi:hypothetical protein